MNNSILSLKNISIFYRTHLAVSDVSFDVLEGDYFCIVGSNGSGKSSLIKAILGLIPYSGEIKFNVTKEEIAYLPQFNSIPQGMPATVKEVVLSGTQKKGLKLPFYTKKDKKSALDAMEILKISDFSHKKISELSGGQRQRVLLARALCKNPKLLILDEPCAGLDETISESLYATLHELNLKRNVTIIMVSHDIKEVKKYAKRVAVMDGKLKFLGNVSGWQKFRQGDSERGI